MHEGVIKITYASHIPRANSGFTSSLERDKGDDGCIGEELVEEGELGVLGGDAEGEGWKGKGWARGKWTGLVVMTLILFRGRSADLEEGSRGKVQGSVMSARPHHPA